jgi:hypothetical protein
MTTLELEKNDNDFFKIGQKAYHMNIDISGCLYRGKYQELWIKGWRIAKKKFFDHRNKKGTNG